MQILKITFDNDVMNPSFRVVINHAKFAIRASSSFEGVKTHRNNCALQYRFLITKKYLLVTRKHNWVETRLRITNAAGAHFR